MLHPLFIAGIEPLSICSFRTSFGGGNRRGDSLVSGGSVVRGTSTSDIDKLSSSKGKEVLHLSFFIATLVPTMIEYHSSELQSDFGLSGLCRDMGDLVDEATMFQGDVK